MLKALKWVAGVTSIAALVACGGGGDSGTTATAVEKTFPLQQSYQSYLNTAHSYTTIGSFVGTGITVTVTSTGTRSSTPLKAAIFENTAAFSTQETITTNQGAATSIPSITEYYYNSANQLIGYTQRDADKSTLSNYAVLQGSSAGFPASAKIGDKGSLYALNYYTDATKKAIGATTTTAWSLLPGSGGSAAILEISTTGTGVGTTSSASFVTKIQYGIDANNALYITKTITEVYSDKVQLGVDTLTFTGR